MRRAKCIMVQGTMSGVGKSLLCTALCRIFRQDGYRVAPFKSQNMALNSGVTRDGLEIGRAQIAQAEAAGVEPDARMNPILLKPSSDTGSQVIVNGRARMHMSAADYMAYKRVLIPEVLAAYESLASEHEIVVIEGAGSPAEINLRENDIVNMGLAELVDAPVLLAGDIDRGGVFAQLYGTVALLEADERARVRGLIVNKFRGDEALLRPGLRQIEEKTGAPVLGVVPYLRAELDDEDSLAPRLSVRKTDKPIDIAVIRLPHISNFTDFTPLEQHGQLGVRYVNDPEALQAPDCIILPGTKSTVDDLLWLRRNGLEERICALAAAGTPVLGVCGGYQMLGEELRDPSGVESDTQALCGMGLLPCTTVFAPEKTLTRVRAAVTGGTMDGARIEGYEIHMGETQVRGEAFCVLEDGRPDGCRRGSVCGTYLHGLFDSGETTERIAAWLCGRKGVTYAGGTPEPRRAFRERQYDLLADGVRAALDMDAIYRIMEG
ncbi:MAG: cobyric acid synthase [Ruminococcaceae bacterium]|nr:cobyric acid synthase [Oscillospiraceae bacterium]